MDMFELLQPVISAVTGITDQKHIKRASESTINQIISKPVNVDVLTSLIEQMEFPTK
jgi:response regulator RpfG family c-di-GMP phosphodiesterase